MLSSGYGLLRTVECPDRNCKRPACVFHHTNRVLEWFDSYIKRILGEPTPEPSVDQPQTDIISETARLSPPLSPLPPESYEFLDSNNSPPLASFIQPGSPTRPAFVDDDADDTQPPPAKRTKLSTIEQLLDEAKGKTVQAQKPPPTIAPPPRPTPAAAALKTASNVSTAHLLHSLARTTSSTTPSTSSIPTTQTLSESKTTTSQSEPTKSANTTTTSSAPVKLEPVPFVIEQPKPAPKPNLFTNRAFPLANLKPKEALPSDSTTSAPKPKATPKMATPVSTPAPSKQPPAKPSSKPHESIAKAFAPKPQAKVMIFDESAVPQTKPTSTTSSFDSKPSAPIPEPGPTTPQYPIYVTSSHPIQPAPLTNLSTDTRPIIDVRMDAKVSRLLRQKYVDMFFPFILKYYTGETDPTKVDPAMSRMAVQKALEFEKKVLGICATDASYRSSANRALVKLQKEGYKPPDDEA